MRHWLSTFASDLRFAARTFRKRPGFAATAVLTLSLGIGATTAVFSIVDAVLLRPLPYKDPARLVAVWITSTREQSLAKLFAIHRNYLEFRRHSRTLEDVAAATWAVRTGSVLTGFGPAREVMTVPASVSFFDTLGVAAAIGRTFRPDDEARGCAIVATHQFWKSTLASDPSAIGRSLTLDQKPCTLLGVMPESFAFYPRQTQAWILLGPNFQPDQDRMFVGIFARLRPGVTIPQAQTELRGLFRANHTGRDTRDFEPAVYALQGEFTFLAGRTLRTTLLLVFAAVLFVLLIACLNVAHLLLARLSERSRELAVRAALGSGQGRLVRQLLTEGLLLSGFGAGLGVAFAYAAVRYFQHADPIELSVGAGLALNLPVLFFCAALSIAATLVFALLPALRASRVDLTQHLKTAGRGSIGGHRRLANLVIAVEMALSLLLLIGAGLLMTSAIRMGSESLGFSPDRISTIRVSPPVFRYATDRQRTEVYDRLLARLERIPGIAGVALASKVPPEAGGNQVLAVQGRPVAEGLEIHDVGADAVSPAYFDVLRIPLHRGRQFGLQDRANSQPVAIINDAMAEKYFPKIDPVGQQIRLPGGPMPWLTIVGVVGNVKHTELMNEMKWVETPIFYRPLAQEPRPAIVVAVRTSGDTSLVSREIQRQIASVEPSIPLNDVTPLTSSLSKTLAYPRFRAVVLAFFAVAALLLSAVGLHGVLSQLVISRTPELGVRRAVGAQTHDLLWLIGRQAGLPVLAGLAAGTGLTVAMSRALSNLLYGVQPVDAATLVAASAVLLAAAAIAALAPSLRAAHVDPMQALRDQ